MSLSPQFPSPCPVQCYFPSCLPPYTNKYICAWTLYVSMGEHPTTEDADELASNQDEQENEETDDNDDSSGFGESFLENF